MLRNLLLAVVGVFALVVAPAVAADDKKKETKLEGELVCPKCVLKEADKCGNALQVKDGDKKITYYLDDKGAKEEYHKACCTKAAKATITGGEVTEKDGKKTLKGTFKVEVAKDSKKEDKKDK
jgi:hypothetical protein